MKLLSRLLFWITGWKVKGEFPHQYKKAVMTAAPHTSNWDFLFARAAFFIFGVPVKYTIKKEFMVFPLNYLLRWLGAIPIDRKPNPNKPKRSMVEAMQALFEERERLVILVTPEGTRAHVPKWKTGFYHVANGVNVPIILGYLDYKKKEAGIGPVIHPNGDVEGQIEEIMAFYRTINAKYPENGVK